MKTKNFDMLKVPLFSGMIRFAIPVALTAFLSLLFNAVDLIVVGRYCGSQEMAAVGSTSSLVALIVNFFLGISLGSGVLVAQCIGAKQPERIKRAVHSSIPLAVIIGLFLTVAGLFLVRPLLKIMGTPADIIESSQKYLTIYFYGITLRVLYNYEAAILRAAGDTKTPMLSLAMGGILNVGFNLFFVLVLEMGVAGVAYGTIVSEGISSITCLIVLMCREDVIKFRFRDMCLDFKLIKQILAIGIPVGVQNSMFSISNTLMQASINSFGSVVVAGNAAASNITGFIDGIGSGIPSAALNFMGQAYGAKNNERIRKIPKCAALICLIVMIPVGILVNLFGKQLLSIYITDSSEAIKFGALKFIYVVLPYALCTMQSSFSASIRGMGKGFIPMINSICGICGVRILIIFTVFRIERFHTIKTLYLAYPISWIFTLVVDIIVFGVLFKKLGKPKKSFGGADKTA